MSVDEHLSNTGIWIDDGDLEPIWRLLIAEVEKEEENASAGDTELIKLLCVQLFGAGHVEDSLLVWRAKSASMDTGASIDVQLLCGAGLEETKRFLEESSSDGAAEALTRIRIGEKRLNSVAY